MRREERKVQKEKAAYATFLFGAGDGNFSLVKTACLFYD